MDDIIYTNCFSQFTLDLIKRNIPFGAGAVFDVKQLPDNHVVFQLKPSYRPQFKFQDQKTEIISWYKGFLNGCAHDRPRTQNEVHRLYCLGLIMNGENCDEQPDFIKKWYDKLKGHQLDPIAAQAIEVLTKDLDEFKRDAYHKITEYENMMHDAISEKEKDTFEKIKQLREKV